MGVMWSLQQQAGMVQVDFVHEADRGFLRSTIVAAGHGLMKRRRRRSLNGYNGIVCLLQCDGNIQVLLILFSLLLALMIHGSSAQQAYNDVNGYTCTAQSLQRCTAYTLYRTQSSQENLTSVTTLFNTTASLIATTSSLKLTDSSLPSGTPLYIPLACNCVRRSYQGNVSRTYEATVSWHIVSGNTFWLIANGTYAGLTTYQAIEAANPTQVPTDLKIDSYSTIPLRCACPSATQQRLGTGFLFSFVLFPVETSLEVVSSYFNVSVTDLEAANEVNTSTTLQPFSTLLVPLVKLPPLSSISFVPSSGSASPPSAGGSPTSPSSSSPASASDTTQNGSSSNRKMYIGVAIGIAIGFVSASTFGICLFLVCWRKKMKMDPGYGRYSGGSQTVKMISAPTEDISGGHSKEYDAFLAEMSDVVGSDKPMVFSYQELQEATMDFSDAKRIQGSVFLGKLQGMFVAIKQMKSNMTQELKILTQVHHGNLVRLVGMCLSNSEHVYLVFEYAENGSLSDCLHNKQPELTANFSRSAAFLPWTTRIQIALDVASGLDYIHNYTNPSFVHKDVKSSNILLDAQFRAKVANFGMAKSSANDSAGGGGGGVGGAVMMLTKHIVGTQGYMAPEYLEHGLVTPKADVFAFGVVLLEILSGQEAIVRPAAEGDDDGKGKERVLSSVIGDVLEGDNYKEKLRAWIDPLLQNSYPLDTACNVAHLAKTCVDSDPSVRPNMKEITYALSKMLASSLEWESSAIFRSTRDMHGFSIEAR